jgi:rhodanese-related sulfurtransferase
MPPGQTHKSPFVDVFESGKRYVFYCTAGGCSVPANQQMKKKWASSPLVILTVGSVSEKIRGGPIEEVEKL